MNAFKISLQSISFYKTREIRNLWLTDKSCDEVVIGLQLCLPFLSREDRRVDLVPRYSSI